MRPIDSLWRGSVLLGRLRPELPAERPDTYVAVLQPADAFTPADAVHQAVWPGVPGAPVWQMPLPPRVRSADERRDSSRMEMRASVGPRVTSLAELQAAVPPEARLWLGDDSGDEVSTTMIDVTPMPRVGRDVARLCAEAGVPFSGWCVTAKLAGHSPHAP